MSARERPSGQAPASLRRRLAAAAIDLLIILVYAAALALAVFALSRISAFRAMEWPQRIDSAAAWDLLAFATLILPVVLYFAARESSPRQATIGKVRLGICVAGAGGGRLSFGRALLRSAVKFLPWQMAHTAVFQIRSGNQSAAVFALSIAAQLLVVVYLLCIAIDRRRRAPYDWLAGSRVADSIES